MTEREKMLSGMPYNGEHPELVRERANAKDLCYKYNNTANSDVAAQRELIKRLIGKTGEKFTFVPPFWCDYGGNIEIGENFFVNHNCVMLDCAKITIGKNVLIAPDCGIYTAAHPLSVKERATGAEYALPITIGDDVWIGGGVRILPGVTIGNGSVIGAGSVVTKNIPANVVAAGNPCRVLRKITDDEAPLPR